MSVRTCNIECRFGDRDIDDPPSDEDIIRVIAEVLDEPAVMEAYPDLVTGDLEEHPNAWLHVSDESGGSWALDLYRTGLLLLTAYSDNHFERERLHARLQSATIPSTAALWMALRDGAHSRVEREFTPSE